MMDHQIDLEEAIAAVSAASKPKRKSRAKPRDADPRPTLLQFAKEHDIPLWRVRRAAVQGQLQCDRSKQPMRVEGGEVPMSIVEWRKLLEPAVNRIKPSQRAWIGDTLLVLTRDARTHAFKRPVVMATAKRQLAEIEALDTLKV
jgi:hypothetical protein